MATEIAVSSAISFFQSAASAAGKPLPAAFSQKSAVTDIAVDASRFGEQLVTQVNQSFGSDQDATTMNIDEFTRLASGDRFKTFNSITNASKRDVVKNAFDAITGGNKSLATAGDVGEFLRVQDGKDGKVDGHVFINFLI